KDGQNLKGGPKDGGKGETAKADAKGEGDESPQTASNQGQAKDDGGDKSGPKAGAKGDETPKGGEAQAKDGMNPDGSQGPPQGTQSQPGSPKTKDELAKNQKKIQEAGYDMAKAEENLKDNKKKPAIKNEGEAIDKLQEVKDNLEKLLRQTREEELERLLAAL